MKSLSIVIPCLNEEKSLPSCLEKIKQVLQKENIEKTEIIVVDNGSTDKSIEVAQKFNTKVIKENKKGYGSALRTGIKHASSEYIAFADADDSYDFLELDKFIQKAREGFEVIQGCRFKKYGGNILVGAMPFSHQYFGNPFLSFMTKLFFGIKFNDVYCGFRMFKKSTYEKNFYFSNGMEFAVENIIKLFFSTKKYVEIPITLHKDKRKDTSSHLRTLSDGLKTLKFILLQGSQIPSLILSAIFMLFSFRFFLKVDLTDMTYMDTSFLIAVIFFLASIQFIFFSLYANLASLYLGFKKNKFALKIFKFINFSKSLLLSILLLIISVFLLLNVKLEIFNLENYSLIIGLTTLGISIQLIINILIVSVLEFFKKN